MTIHLAHGVGSLYQLPLPLSLYLGGAALAVMASFVVQIFSRGHSEREPRRIASARAARRMVSIATMLGLVWLLLVVVFSFLEPDPGFTLAPLLFWVAFVVGGVLLSTLISGLWSRANPWITLERVARPVGLDEAPKLRPPAWLGPLLIYVLFWFELVSTKGFDPGFIFILLVLYTGYVLSFRARFGDQWQLIDPFAILFGFAERSAPLQITDDGLYYRGAVAGLVEEKPMPIGLFASVFILLGSTTLDNAKETIAWSDFIRDSGLISLDPVLLGSLALAFFSIPFLVPYVTAIAVATRWVRDTSLLDVARTYAWSLVPIGIAYVLAHNMPLLIIGGPLIADRILGAFTGDALASYVPSPKLVWFLEIGFIVIGHILGVVSAHRIAQRITGSHRDALKSHIALTVLMSLFTIGTLFLLAQPLVRR